MNLKIWNGEGVNLYELLVASRERVINDPQRGEGETGYIRPGLVSFIKSVKFSLPGLTCRDSLLVSLLHYAPSVKIHFTMYISL